MNLIAVLPRGIQEFIERHPGLSLVAKGLGYLLSERLLKILIGFFVHAYMARYLGPEHFGKLTYIIKTVTVFFVFGTFGVDEIIIKLLLAGEHREEDIIKTVVKLRLKMSVLGLLALIVFLVIFQPESLMFSLLTVAYGVNIFIQSFNVYELSFQAHMNFKPLFWGNNLSYFISSGLRVAGVIFHQGITFFLATYLAGELILKTFMFKSLGLKRAAGGKDSSSLRRDLFQKSWPYFISTFVLMFDQRVSFYFIEYFRSLEELGNYSVAVTLVDLWAFLPTAIAAVVFPSIVSSHKLDENKYNLRIQYLSDVLCWISYAFAVSLFVLAPIVVSILYGDRYPGAGEILALYGLTAIPLFYNFSRIKWFTLENRLSDWLWINLVCTTLNIVGHFYLVPQMGVKGAIYSYLGAQAVGNVVVMGFSESARRSVLIFLKTFSFPFRLMKKI